MMKANITLRTLFALGLATGGLALATAPTTAGPGEKGHAHGHQGHGGGPGDHSMPGGMPGKAEDVSRTIVIIAKDTAFNLKKIQVKDGETIRFVVKNKGELVHEMTIGTPEMQKAHQVEMMKMMDAGHLHADKVTAKMDHSHGNSVLVEPGKQAEFVWMFHKGAQIEFGCNVPGHYDQGMKGEFEIKS